MSGFAVLARQKKPRLGLPNVGERCNDRYMAYDEELARRIRERFLTERDVVERRMFGGLAFLLDGSMTVAASGTGGLLARVDPDEGEALCRADGVAPTIMNRRPMRGWLQVAPDVIETDEALDEWVARCIAYVKGTINAPTV